MLALFQPSVAMGPGAKRSMKCVHALQNRVGKVWSRVGQLEQCPCRGAIPLSGWIKLKTPVPLTKLSQKRVVCRKKASQTPTIFASQKDHCLKYNRVVNGVCNKQKIRNHRMCTFNGL